MKLKRNSTTTKVATDLFAIQMNWALWFVGIVFIVYLVLPIFITDVESLNLAFPAFIFQSTKIFMLVIGILSCFSFLAYFVGNGITRKEYYIGSAVSAFGIAAGILIIATVLQGVLLLVGTFTAYTPNTGHGMDWNVSSVWLIPMVIYIMSTLAFYVSGWLISIGFYRYGGFGGFLAIIGAIIYVSLSDLGSGGGHSIQLFGFIRFTTPELGLPYAIMLTTVLLVAGLYLLRQLTKRVPIKI